MNQSVVCYDDVAWSELNETPTREISRSNDSCPREGEVRSVLISHPDFDPMKIGNRMWLLYQSGLSLANGFPEPDEELENAAVVEVEFLATELLSKKPNYWGVVESWAQVSCLKVVPLCDIPKVFAPSEPVNWPQKGKRCQPSETKHFVFIWFITEASTEWFVIAKEPVARLIMSCNSIGKSPFEICNCPSNFEEWPHVVDKSRKHRKN